MFTLRAIGADGKQAGTFEYELTPSSEEGQKLCALFAELLANRPPEFRDKLEFVNRGEFELEWTAAAGGAAMASFYSEGRPVCLGILVSGMQPSVDSMMIEAFEQTVLRLIYGDESMEIARLAERPCILFASMPETEQWTGAAQLMYAAIGSVYFRAVLQLSQEEGSNG